MENFIGTKVVCGPLLRYIEIDYEKRMWRGSCLIVLKSAQPPLLSLCSKSDIDIHVKPTQVESIDIFQNEYYFWRYELLLPLRNDPQTVIYTSDCFSRDTSFQFHLPAIQDSMRFVFYSCGGFSNFPQSIKDLYNEKGAPLWKDILDRHEVMPIHVLLGGGDQLYQDSLIYKDFMKPWVAERDPQKRLNMKLSQAMKDGFESFFFWNYVENFG